MEPVIEIIEPRLYAGAGADEIAASLSERIVEAGSASIALSGGSTPATIYRNLALPPRVTDVDWSKVKFFWGDERWVSHDDPQSNFRMASEKLLNQISKSKPKVFPVNTSASSPDVAALEYENTLKQHQGNDEYLFDLVLLGIGEDGHTASLFPGSPALMEGSRLCVATENPHEKTSRISLTYPAIFKARQILVLVSGEGKGEVVKRILQAKDASLPATRILSAPTRVTWFLDTPAGGKLDRRA